MNFRDIAEQNENWIIEQRRYFHAHPELSFEEKNTTHEIGKCLEEMGLTPHYYPDYNGLWAIIKGGKSTPWQQDSRPPCRYRCTSCRRTHRAYILQPESGCHACLRT